VRNAARRALFLLSSVIIFVSEVPDGCAASIRWHVDEITKICAALNIKDINVSDCSVKMKSVFPREQFPHFGSRTLSGKDSCMEFRLVGEKSSRTTRSSTFENNRIIEIFRYRICQKMIFRQYAYIVGWSLTVIGNIWPKLESNTSILPSVTADIHRYIGSHLPLPESLWLAIMSLLMLTVSFMPMATLPISSAALAASAMESRISLDCDSARPLRCLVEIQRPIVEMPRTTVKTAVICSGVTYAQTAHHQNARTSVQ
jgi:hypothetical protein